MRKLSQAGPQLVDSLKLFAGREYAKGRLDSDALMQLNRCLNDVMAIIVQGEPTPPITPPLTSLTAEKPDMSI